MEKYNGWLTSNCFYKRSLATVGHYLTGYLIILLSLLLVGGVFGLLYMGINAIIS